MNGNVWKVEVGDGTRPLVRIVEYKGNYVVVGWTMSAMKQAFQNIVDKHNDVVEGLLDELIEVGNTE